MVIKKRLVVLVGGFLRLRRRVVLIVALEQPFYQSSFFQFLPLSYCVSGDIDVFNCCSSMGPVLSPDPVPFFSRPLVDEIFCGFGVLFKS